MELPNTLLLSQEMALRRRLDVTANNLANADTPGFRRENPVFREFVETMGSGPVRSARPVSFVLDFGTGRDLTPGTVRPTGGPLDVAIDGPGYLSVKTADGGVAYTRAGRLSVGSDGILNAAGGRPVLDASGQPISVDPSQISDLAIASDGTVTSRSGPVGRLGLIVFDDPRGLMPRGDSLLDGRNGKAVVQGDIRLRSGMLEGSNVQPIVETTEMVEIMRAYELGQRLSSSLDDLRKRAIERLGRVN